MLYLLYVQRTEGNCVLKIIGKYDDSESLNRKYQLIHRNYIKRMKAQGIGLTRCVTYVAHEKPGLPTLVF